MSTGSSIEWTDATWNPVVGCTRASAGCDHCYAVAMTHRLEGMGQSKYAGLTVLNPRGERHFNGVVRTDEAALGIPLRWKKPRRVFVNSMSDLFHKDVPFEFIDRVFAVMNATAWRLPIPEDVTKTKPWHTYQVLTKRPERMAEYLASRMGKFKLGKHPLFQCRDIFCGHGPDLMNASAVLQWPMPNVWLGTSCENQAMADERVPHLLACPAAVRFLSCEPLLGPIDFMWDRSMRIGLDWVIVGGESGHGARPMNPEWARSIRDQCFHNDVAFFMKQMGGAIDKRHDLEDMPEDLRIRQFPQLEATQCPA